MIVLRDLAESDRDTLFQWRNLPEVRKWMYTDHEIARDEHDAWFASVLKDESRRSWIIELDTHGVGVISLSMEPDAEGRALLGIYLAEPSARGHGVARCALEGAIEQAFSGGLCAVVAAEAVQSNHQALRTYEAVGMKVTAMLEPPHRLKPAVRLELSRNDWQGPTPRNDGARSEGAAHR